MTRAKGATLRDVAREADVSIASASRAINGLDNVAAEVRGRVLEAASKLRYIPHAGARSLVMSKTNTIGLLLPDIYGEFFSEIIRGVDMAARARGLHLLVSGSHGDLGEAVAAVQAMGGRVDGLLVMSPFADAQDLMAVLPANLPFVTIASRLHQLDQGAIFVDNFIGGERAAQHLVDCGRTQLFHISGPPSNFEAQERFRGFSSVLAAHGVDAETRFFEGDFTEESGYGATQAILARGERPDGIFLANDMMAVGCLIALKEAGLSVPEDVSVIGYDDVPIARFTSPPLTTMRVGVQDLGQKGLELLVKAIAREPDLNTQGIVISPELVIRGTTLNEKRPIQSRPKKEPNLKN